MQADAPPNGELVLAGPSERFDRARLPLRGDLAHIRLAGRCFVSHYAVPDGYVVSAAGASLRVAGRDAADAVAELAAGTRFDVLDIAGSWAWGQVASGRRDDGLVGYVAIAALERP